MITPNGIALLFCLVILLGFILAYVGFLAQFTDRKLWASIGRLAVLRLAQGLVRAVGGSDIIVVMEPRVAQVSPCPKDRGVYPLGGSVVRPDFHNASEGLEEELDVELVERVSFDFEKGVSHTLQLTDIYGFDQFKSTGETADIRPDYPLNSDPAVAPADAVLRQIRWKMIEELEAHLAKDDAWVEAPEPDEDTGPQPFPVTVRDISELPDCPLHRQ